MNGFIGFINDLEIWQKITLLVVTVLTLFSIIIYIVEKVFYAKNKGVKFLHIYTKGYVDGKTHLIIKNYSIKKINRFFIDGNSIPFLINKNELVLDGLFNERDIYRVDFENKKNVLFAKGYFLKPENTSIINSNNKSKMYTITWKSEGQVIYSCQVQENEMPIYRGDVPVKDGTINLCFKFLKWNPEISIATANKVYNAEFESVILHHSNENEDEFVEETNEEGQKSFVVYKKSFLAKICTSHAEIKSYYIDILNYLLSIKKVHIRNSFACSTFSIGRKVLAKITIRGKTLTMYLALDPKKYIESKYYGDDCGMIKKYEEVPLKIKVKSERGVKFAKELIDEIISFHSLEKNEIYEFVTIEDYPYKGKEELLKEGLIKKLFVNKNPNQFFMVDSQR